jgi:hypothetical protein
MKTQGDYARLLRSAITALTLGVIMMFVAVPSLHADGRAKCQAKIEAREAKLHEAVHRYGPRSPQADNWRRALNAEREACWNKYHGWWNGEEHRWHEERDWDREHDHDMDRDRH